MNTTHPMPQSSLNSAGAAEPELAFVFWEVHMKLVLPLPQLLTTTAKNSLTLVLSPKKKNIVI